MPRDLPPLELVAGFRTQHDVEAKKLATKNNFIIGEGVDRAGKTTVLSALSAKTGIPYYKGERYPLETNDKFGIKMAENIQFAGVMSLVKPNLIVDRFHLSELAYAMAFGRKIDEDIMEMVDRKLNEANAVIVYFDTPIDVCLQRLTPFSPLTEEHYKRLKESYQKLLVWTSCPVVLLEPDQTSQTDGIVSYIINHLKLPKMT